MKSTAILVLLASVVLGCSSVTLTVNSTPGKAKVFVRPLGAGESLAVGTTPVVLTRQQLLTAGAQSGPVVVEVQQDEFITERVLVTESAAVDMKLDFALRLESELGGGQKTGVEDIQSLNQAIDRLFEVRRFISLESYGEALKHLSYIEENWPQLAATYEMKAGIFFLQKKYRDALAAYAMALKYNPKNVQAAQMRESLEKDLGISGDELVREYEVKRIPAGEAKKAGKKGGKKSKKKKPGTDETKKPDEEKKPEDEIE
ncbi:MAG: hypothetical protein ABL958_02070 [Bdellovibrionia bacterium]